MVVFFTSLVRLLSPIDRIIVSMLMSWGIIAVSRIAVMWRNCAPGKLSICILSCTHVGILDKFESPIIMMGL